MEYRGMIQAVHPDWRLTCLAGLHEMINCAGCGRRIEFGQCYTSLERMSDNGLWGLAVCPNCYDGEISRKYMEVD